MPSQPACRFSDHSFLYSGEFNSSETYLSSKENMSESYQASYSPFIDYTESKITQVNNTVNCFSVNAISFHPIHGTFSTAGSDGTFHFWDRDAHHRIKGFPPVGAPISATAFNNDGTIFSYAVSYDWSKGYAYNTPQHTNNIMLHAVAADECKLKPTTNRH
jgi:hypothetical protein